jgi:hypothetical protein
MESTVNARDHRSKHELDVAAPRARTCVIYAKPTGAQGYGWGWESGDKRRRSKGYFRYFYECVQDARKHGFDVEYAQVAEHLKSSGARDHV